MASWTITRTWSGLPIDPSHHIHVSLAKVDHSTWEVTVDAPFHDEPAPTQPPGRLWRLWEYEVVELFLVAANGHYVEAEFGPHGHHLFLALEGPRDIVDDSLPMTYSAQIQGDRWTGKAHFNNSCLPGEIDRANVFAISGPRDQRQFLAWSILPGPESDFHQPHRFPQVII